MTANLIIAAALFLSALILTTILLRLRLVRNSNALRIIFILNPGLVGAFASLAFLSKVYFPSITLACYIASLFFILASLPAIIIVIPRAMFPHDDQ